MKPALPGLHHVTAITANAQKNHDFYTQTLGLRLVKLTVNFDDPSSYHLYYGDSVGSPGTIMTFFAGEGAIPGRIGNGQATTTVFSVPIGTMNTWRARLEKAGFPVKQLEVWGQQRLEFTDPDGLQLALSEDKDSKEDGISGFAGVVLGLARPAESHRLFTETLGFELVAEDSERRLYRSQHSWMETLTAPGANGRMGAGTVHHIAWRTPDDAHQELWLERLQGQGLRVSPVMDRNYFHSIYFREPGGVLFEIATDPPGFTVDQPLEELGRKLVLPSWLEPHREKIQRFLPPLKLPQATPDFQSLGS
ncbi:ring-cleaving dioxygenase [bacterium]|nr:ring-cleaving dioxygenase [bacterium]